jgi:chromosome segregation ATPase
VDEDYKDIIIKLNDNIQSLMASYSTIKEDNIILSNEVNKLNSELNIYKEKLEEIENKYNNLRLARSIADGDSDDKDVKLKLNRIIREIDNCIALLNK